MKRRALCLILPLLLAAIVFGVKWHADHPTPIPEDLRIRALMVEAKMAHVQFYPSSFSPQNDTYFRSDVSGQDLKALSDTFYLTPRQGNRQLLSKMGRLVIFCRLDKTASDGTRSVTIYLNCDRRWGRVTIDNPEIGRELTEWTLHPLTIQKWLALLSTDPIIGPQLRARPN